MGWVVERLAEPGQLRPGVSPELAAHVVWLLAGFDAFDALAAGRALEPEESRGS
jgi:hypothetical protein